MKTVIFCPECGAKLPKFEWYRKRRDLPGTAGVSCDVCGAVIFLKNKRFIDQEDIIEIIFH